MVGTWPENPLPDDKWYKLFFIQLLSEKKIATILWLTYVLLFYNLIYLGKKGALTSALTSAPFFPIYTVHHSGFNIFWCLMFPVMELQPGVRGFRLSNQPIFLVCSLQASLEVEHVALFANSWLETCFFIFAFTENRIKKIKQMFLNVSRSLTWPTCRHCAASLYSLPATWSTWLNTFTVRSCPSLTSTSSHHQILNREAASCHSPSLSQ